MTMKTLLLAVPLFSALPGLAQPVFESPEERGWAVLEKALKAAGGREKLAAVKDMSFDLQTRIVMTQGGELDLPSKVRFILPDTVRQEITTPAGIAVIAFDRWAGWRRAPNGHDQMPAEELRRAHAELARANILFRPPTNRATVRWAGADTAEGRTCDILEITNVGGVALRLWVDRQNGDVIKRTYRGEGPDGKPAEVEELLSDYREVDGLRLSFKVRVTRNGRLARETVTRDIQLNKGLKAEDLLQVGEK